MKFLVRDIPEWWIHVDEIGNEIFSRDDVLIIEYEKKLMNRKEGGGLSAFHRTMSWPEDQ